MNPVKAGTEYLPLDAVSHLINLRKWWPEQGGPNARAGRIVANDDSIQQWLAQTPLFSPPRVPCKHKKTPLLVRRFFRGMELCIAGIIFMPVKDRELTNPSVQNACTALAEGKMRAFAVTLLALYLSAGAATAQTDQEMIWAVGEVGEELQVCSIYFTVVSGCLQHQEPALSETYMQMARRTALSGAKAKQSAGVSPEAYLAFSDVLFKDMKKSMGGNCTNIAVLLKKYMSFCQQLSQDADPRLKEWIACIRGRATEVRRRARRTVTHYPNSRTGPPRHCHAPPRL